MNCSTCIDVKSCELPCDRLKAAIRPSWSTGLRELAIGAAIDAVPSSQAPAPVTTKISELPGLRVIEDRIVRYFYEDGMSYRQISKKLCKKKNYVKITIKRARTKIKRSPKYESFSAISDGSIDG